MADFQPCPALRFPRLRLKHQESRSFTRPKVNPSSFNEKLDKDLKMVGKQYFKASPFQVPDGWPGDRVRGRFPHRLQQMAPRVPAKILERSSQPSCISAVYKELLGSRLSNGG